MGAVRRSAGLCNRVCGCCCHRFPQIQFEYNDPSAGFDRRRVRGPVVRLMRVREREAATALEVTAGGRVRRGEGGGGVRR